MQITNFILNAAAVFTGLVSSIPIDQEIAISSDYAPIEPAPAPTGESYLEGYPLCHKPGFTEVGNFYVESTHSHNSSTRKCLNDCRRNATVTFINALFGKAHKQSDGSWGGCGSISFAERYGLCNFYDKSVENTQLIYDNTSNFVHYDLFCSEGLFGNKGLFGWF